MTDYADDDGDEAAGEPADVVRELLAEGVPMTLIADLVDPAGPPSPVILEEEGLPEETWWEPGFEPDDDGG